MNVQDCDGYRKTERAELTRWPAGAADAKLE